MTTPELPHEEQSIALGALVGSSSHIMQEARIYDEYLVERPPEPHEFAFGTFVSLTPTPRQRTNATVTQGLPIGVIANSRLLNPDDSYAGPRLTVPQTQNAVFAPDYLNERGIEVSILLLGTWHQSHGEQGVIGEVLPVGSEVKTLPADHCYAFHHAANGAFQMRYAPLLQELRPGLSLALLQSICRHIEPLCTESEVQMLRALRKHIAWQATFQGS